MKQKFTINCWRTVGKIYEVEAESEDEAKKIAESMFEDEDLNKCVFCDGGTDVC